jgi:hypothetical protein
VLGCDFSNQQKLEELHKAAVFEMDKNRRTRTGCLSASLKQSGLSQFVHENCFMLTANISKSGKR